MSIYIAFFSIFAVIILLSKIRGLALANRPTRKAAALWGTFLGIFLVLGIEDQTTKNFIPPYAAIKAEYRNDAKFVNDIERIVAPNSMIYQMPYMTFPEFAPTYDLFRCVLHSHQLRWSHGTMRGRPGDQLQKELAAQPIDQLIGSLRALGFRGIYVDRMWLGDGGSAMEAQLTKTIGQPTLISDNKRLLFFKLEDQDENPYLALESMRNIGAR